MITRDTYAARRQKLAELLQKPIVLAAHMQMQAKADTPYKFTQDASFYYYTGIEEPDWKVLFDGNEWHLAAPDVSDTHRIFDGALSDDDAKKLSGIESVLTAESYSKTIVELSEKSNLVAAISLDPSAKRYDFHENPARADLEKELRDHFKEVYDCRLDINRQRAIKTAEEISEIQSAIDGTVVAFEKLKKQLTVSKHEYELEALLNYEFRHSGLGGHAYDPIIAGGKNACTLHYVKNNDVLPSSGLVLIDSGAKSNGGYAADITRTYAIGTPTKREKAVHSEIEKAHHQIIALLRPDLIVEEYQQKVEEIMRKALNNLGLLQNDDDYHTYFPHSVSHGLGIDVHDPLGMPKLFATGMVLTVEPGIYIPEEGIGVRIEDDILITEDGHRNLSAQLPTSL